MSEHVNQTNSCIEQFRELLKQPIADNALDGKTVLITGAAGDLGSQLAQCCSAHRATVILLDKQSKKLEALYDQIVDNGYPEPIICAVDLLVAQPAVYDDLFNQLREQFGILDSLVHCAALFDAPSPIIDIEALTWQQHIHLNLTVPCLITSRLLPLLQDAPNSRIIFTTDSVARNGSAYWGAYGVAKAGLEQFAQILADELMSAGRVNVNTVIPGAIHSQLRHSAFPAEAKQSRIPIEQILPVYLHLLVESGNEVHGQILDAVDLTGQ